MPDGEFSTGTCKKCGETRVSRNWEPELTAMYKAAGLKTGGKNKKTPGQQAFGHAPIRNTHKPEGVFTKQGRVR